MSNALADRAYSEGNRIQVGYSKSDRSSCKQCGDGILKDALRIGQLVGSPANGIGPKWCHPDCFLAFIKSRLAKSGEWFQKYVPVDPEQIPGFGSLTADDKARINDLVALGKNPVRYVVTVTESRTESGDVQLMCTNMSGDPVCPNVRAEDRVVANLRRHVAKQLGKREEEVELVCTDGSLFQASSQTRTKRKASEMATAMAASAGGA